MQDDTTNGRTDRRTYLKAIGAGTLITGIAGLAGCLGAEAETRDNSDGNGSAADANGAQEGKAETDTPTDTSSDSDSGEAESDSGNCEALKSALTSYDAANTPLVYTFDYPSDLELEELPKDLDFSNIPKEDIHRDEMVAVRAYYTRPDEYVSSLHVQMFQWIDAARRDGDSSEYAEDATELSNDEILFGYDPDSMYEFAELDFNDETVPVKRIQRGAESVHFAALPYDISDGERRYYKLQIDLLGVTDDDGSDRCPEINNDLAEKMVQSIRPNPNSTIESIPIPE